VQSAAPPKQLSAASSAAIIADGSLSNAQLESVAHAGYLAGAWTVDDTFDVVSAASDDADNAVRFRRDWFLGDGTDAGKGRQVAGILLDNWLKGRHRAVWISKSDKLRRCAARLVSARSGAAPHHAAFALSLGHADPARDFVGKAFNSRSRYP
jgi:P-loop containing NTP hydrolase pore-1